ncbi:uncharacterized protein LOC135819565 isoform X2 [Sycon ciliatum]|uniref:uncharacterized protein LOC135819565 isoform X2 n=1 Tax=Sycon ciliatum TaxID=27933 RepID=UPI0031F60838
MLRNLLECLDTSSETKTRTVLGRQKTLRRRGSTAVLVDFRKRYGEGPLDETFGVCMSGGGVRSAMFCAGAFESILERDLEVDYLSTVSGGGYVGSSYMDWKFRNGGKDSPVWHQRYFRHIVDNFVLQFARFEISNYLGCLDMVYRAFALAWGVGFMTFCAPFSILFCIQLLYATTVKEPVRSLFDVRPPSNIGSHLPVCLFLLVTCFLLSLFSNWLNELLESGRSFMLRHYVLISLVGALCRHGLIASLICARREYAELSELLCSTCEATDAMSSRECTVLSLLFSVAPLLVIWICTRLLPASDTSRLPIYIVYVSLSVFILEREVFLEESEKWHNIRYFMILCSLLNPILMVYQQNFSFLAYKGCMRRGFFHPDGNLTTSLKQRFCPFAESLVRERGFSSWLFGKGGHDKRIGNQQKDELRLGDLCDMKPEWICQMTLNKWKYDAEDPRDINCKCLTLSNRLVDIIDYRDADMSKYLDLTPQDVTLSHLTGTLMDTLRELVLFVGLHVDTHIPAWFVGEHRTKSVFFFIKSLLWSFSLQMLLFAGLVLPHLFPDLVVSRTLLLIAGATFDLVFFLLSLFPSSDQYRNSTGLTKTVGNMARMLVTHCTPSLLLREVVLGDTCGKYPDFVLNLSDGAHLDNLGLLPLLRRRTSKIVLLDASAYYTGDHSELLTVAMDFARQWLECRFKTLTGEDVDEDLIRAMGAATGGKSPHCYRLVVEYVSRLEDGVLEVVQTGEILVVQPRHPDDLVESMNSGPVQDHWTKEYAERQCGFFARRWNGYVPSFLRPIHGVYPNYLPLHLAPTAQMCETLMEDGRRAISAPAAIFFLRKASRCSLVPS